MEENKGPAQKFRYGALSVTIWENQINTKNGAATVYNSVLSRTYIRNLKEMYARHGIDFNPD